MYGQDDATILDLPTLRKWNAVMRIFVVEYLGLPVPTESGSGSGLGTGIEGRAVAARTDDLVSSRPALVRVPCRAEDGEG